MYVIMGGTGHIGSATAEALLRRGEPVIVITRHAHKARSWRAKGAEIVEAEVNDVPSLRAAFKRGRRALLLNPPADPATDTDAVERRTCGNILAALQGSGLEKVVAVSTGGARPGTRIGDLGTLWELEEGLRRQEIPAAINRGAYYMSNWDAMLAVVRSAGTLPAMFPADLLVPMVAPEDVGRFAADRLMSGVDDADLRYVEGPRRYSPTDVAKAFSRALSRPIAVEVTPRAEWIAAFQRFGFSQEAAQSYAGMTALCIDKGFDMPDNAWRGTVTLDRYVSDLVARPGDS